MLNAWSRRACAIVVAGCFALVLLHVGRTWTDVDLCKDGVTSATLISNSRKELEGAKQKVHELEEKLAKAQQAARLANAVAQANGGSAGGGAGGIAPRMSPTLQRRALPSDAEDWSKRPKKSPSFEELYRQLLNTDWDAQNNVFNTFVNPYHKEAHFNYPHSSIWLKGDIIMNKLIEVLKPDKPRFIAEAGSMHGGSAIRMAMELDKHNFTDVPILCIDPWTGDLNMWLNRIVWEHLDVRDGRATTFDQFMLNVKQAIDTKMITNKHIVPFPVTSIVGARWLQATNFVPNIIYLDSAHEIDETYYELCLYWEILPVGGVLMGDDYGWEAVRHDVDLFVRDYNLELNMFGVYFNWWIKKEA